MSKKFEESDDDIVISGISGRFPNSRNLNVFCDNLFNKIDMVDEAETRYRHTNSEIPRRLGKIDDLEKFDSAFFGISFRQARVMDPQSRMLLEHAYEAILDSGTCPKSLKQSQTGVFIGASYNESEKKWIYEKFQKEGLGVVGSARTMLSNRISFALDLHGPSFPTDTACSSSMYALDFAYKMMSSGECEGALVGGTNLCLHPYVTLQFVKLGVVASDGYCRPFDIDASGYTRAEVNCVMFLQRRRDAKRVYATLLHSKTNSDGFKEEGINFPSSKMQAKLLEDFYKEVGIPPNDPEISYFEAHCTGTKVGDAQECHAIDQVMCKDRQKPLLIGSVKSNMGHAEPGSGVCSISKVILTFENQKIPPTINLKTVKPEIVGVIEGRMQIVDKVQDLKGELISLNSSGFGGANAHCLLRGNPKSKVRRGKPSDDLARLVTWSGRTEEAVNAVFDSVTQQELDVEYIALLQSTQAKSHKANFHKGYALFSDNEDGKNAICIQRETQYFDGVKRPLVYVYSGMGSQWCGMGKNLMKIPIFANAINKCHDVLVPKGVNLKEIITTSDASKFDNILHSFVGIAAIQVALTDVLKAIGLEPDFIVGHSLGELGCAYADGCCEADEMVLSAYSRGMASLETKIVFGSMAAVGLGYSQLKDMLPDGVEIGCHNSFESSTISGPAENVAKFVSELKAKGIFAKEVASSNIPYHSSYIKNLGPNLLARLKQIHKTPKKRSSRWISSSYPQSKWHLDECLYTSAEYQTNNVLSTVLFEEALSHLPANAVAIEIAPHGLLQAILKRTMIEAINLSLVQRGHKNNEHFLMSSLGKIYSNGHDMDIAKLYPPVEFPVSRGTPMIAPHIKWDHSDDHFVMHFDDDDSAKCAERRVKISLNDIEYEYIQGHCIDGRTIFPATGYLFLVWESFALSKGYLYFDVNIEMEDIKFLRATSLTKETDVEFTIVIQPGTGKFEISEGSSALVTGVIREASSEVLSASKQKNNSVLLDMKDFYKELRLRGYHYNGVFRSVQEGSSDGGYGKIKFENWISFLDCLLQIKIIGRDTRNLILPTGIQKISINATKHMEMLLKFKEEEEAIFEAFFCSQMKSTICGGVEIVNLQASPVSRRKPLGVPVLESYEFIPHHPTPIVSTSDACRIISQLFLDVHQTHNVKVVEIDAENEQQSVLPHIRDALCDIPLIISETIFIANREVQNDENITISDKSVANHKECSMIILSNLKQLDDSLQSLIHRGFLIHRTKPQDEIKNFSEFLLKVASVRTQDEVLTVFEWIKEKDKDELSHVFVSEKDLSYEWMEKVKAQMKVSSVAIVAENEPNSGVIGFINCIRKEPGGDKLQCIFIDDKSAPKFDIKEPFYRIQLKLRLGVNVYRNGVWGSYRHLQMQRVFEEVTVKNHCYVNALVKSDLSSLKWLEGPLSSNEKNLVDVHYASLNFKDVMLATGKISADVFVESRKDHECVLGFEYSGIMKDGKRVMGLITSGALATKLKADMALLWECPNSWSLSEAATVPCVYGTVYYAFFMTTNIEKGKSILIHAGTGGIGLAAIRVAFAYGMEVFTTVSTEDKKNFLLKQFPQLKAENIGNSRDISFEKMIMLRTNGKGVDFVLNSLAEEKLQASIRCLGHRGKFLEIGKFDMEKDSKIGMSCFLKELSFHSVMLDKIFSASDAMKLKLAKLIDNDIKSGVIKPLKTNIFPAPQVEQAFRLLASGRHMGKVIIQVRDKEGDNQTLPISVLPRVYCHPEYSYVIPGGLGGFGLELADWLVMRGCQKLVLSSSRGVKKTYQAYRINIWKSYGVDVIVSASDITTRNGCEQLLKEAMKLGPVGGIFNLAVTLRDGVFENLDANKFKESMAPKAYATKFLDELSRNHCPKLHLFVIFSSVACGLGNAGQTNYGMANSIMERIIEHRQKLGLPAKAIQWGAIGEVGLVADMLEEKIDMEIGGTLQQRISSCLEELDHLITSTKPIVASMVVAEKSFSTGKMGSILDTVLNIMGIRDSKSVSMETSLSELGMDSLMTVEIQQTLEREHNFIMSAQDLRSLTLNKLVESVDSKGGTGNGKEEQSVIDGGILIKNLGDEKNADEVLVCFKQCEDMKSMTLLIPGIEGVGGKLWTDIAQKIQNSVYLLQHKNIKNVSSFCEFLENIWQKLSDLMKCYQSVHIVGFSFGSLIALKLANLFEKHDLKVLSKITLVDGSPTFLKTLLKKLLGDKKLEDVIEFLILKTIAEAIIPSECEKALAVIKTDLTLPKKINRLVNETDGLKKYSEEHVFNMIEAIMNRVKMIHHFDENNIEKLENTQVQLIRPMNSALKEIDSDYDLKRFIVKPIDVKFVNGDHLSMLDSPEFTALL